MLRSVCGWDYEDALCADAGGLGAENKPLMNGRWTGSRYSGKQGQEVQQEEPVGRKWKGVKGTSHS